MTPYRVPAWRWGIWSIALFIATAVAEKLSALMPVEYPEERAARGDRGRFDRVLGKFRDVPAPAEDDLASAW